MAAKPLKCPECGADCEPGQTSLEGWDDDLAGGLVFVDFTCHACKAEFTNCYRLEWQEVTFCPDGRF